MTTAAPPRAATGTRPASDTAPARLAAVLPWVVGAAALSLVVTVQSFRDPDVWWHLGVGRLITASGIPSEQPFSFVHAAHPWVGQQWGYEVALARLVDAGGAGAAMLALGVTGSLALLVAALAIPARAATGGPARAAAILVSVLVAGQVMGVRGQVVSMLGVAAVLLIVSRWREGSGRALWALPPLLCVWANLHAGFLAGLAVCLVAVLVTAAERRWSAAPAAASPRALLAATVLAALATLVNPAGPHLWSYVAETFSNPTLTNGIVEWQSPDFHNTWLRVFEVVAVVLVLLWALSRRPDPLDVALAITALAATLQAQRNVALFAVVATPQLARYGAEAWRRRRPRPGRRPLPLPLAATACLAVVVASLLSVAPRLRSSATSDFEASNEPRAAADWVAAHLAGHRLYSTYEWGGYLGYRFPTQRMVFVYGESAVFGDAILQEYLDVHLVRPGWRDVLYREGMEDAVVPAESQEATILLETGWRVDCRDVRSGAVVLSAPPTAPPPGAVPADPAQAPPC